MSLFAQAEAENRAAVKPLAARMRPQSLSEFVGQRHLLAPGKLLRRLLETDRLGSIVLYGPPGTGKTSLAELIARQTKRSFCALNAAASGVKELRELLDRARQEVETSARRTLLFIDELHHFNKTQQQILLPDVEEGIIALIAATTANPFFSLIAPLLSRSQILELQPLEKEDVLTLLLRALNDKPRGLGNTKVTATSEALDFLVEMSDGDARRALCGLEIAVLSLPSEKKVLELSDVEESIQKKALRYDRLGDDHYDSASALIKSLRGSDPDAALYWMARMLEAGEDPRFIARRLVILAAEDVGNADPQALILAQAAAQATEFLGLPECRIPLAQAATYLALAPKSNAAYAAIDAALDDVRHRRLLPVPRHLQDKHFAGAKRLGHGEKYQYPHDAAEGWIAQDYLGVEREYYHPTERGFEAELRRRLAVFRARRRAEMTKSPAALAREEPSDAGEEGSSSAP